MDAARDRLADRGCSVLAVCQAKPELLAPYLAAQGWHVPVVSDPERIAYRVFGLERTGWLTFFRPKVLAGYLAGMLRGYGLKKPVAGEDVLQLGGDFILDRAGNVTFTYRSAVPTDRPTLAQLFDALGDNPSAGPMPTQPPPDPPAR